MGIGIEFSLFINVEKQQNVAFNFLFFLYSSLKPSFMFNMLALTRISFNIIIIIFSLQFYLNVRWARFLYT
jgi:hypothetical protein